MKRQRTILVMLLALVLCMGLGATSVFAVDLPFTDVPKTAWYYGDVEKAVATGLVNGKTATTYGPADNLTYAEAVKLAACMYQKSYEGTVTLTNGKPWYQNYVDYAKDKGIIKKDYDWTAKATRAGYMEIFSNALKAGDLNGVNLVEDGSIPDVSMDHPMSEAIYILYRAGILQGSDSVHSAKPNDNIKRNEVAAILTRMMDKNERLKFTMTVEEDVMPPEELASTLKITKQPVDITAEFNEDFQLRVEVTGGVGQLYYKIYADGKASYGDSWLELEKSGSTWIIKETVSLVDTNKNPRVCYFLIEDEKGNRIKTNTFTLTPKTAPEQLNIVSQPTDISAKFYDTITLRVEVTGGEGNLSWQKYVDGKAVDDGKWTSLEKIGNLWVIDELVYMSDSNKNPRVCYYKIKDEKGNSIQTYNFTLTPIEDAPLKPLELVKSPLDKNVFAGTKATFEVEVTGGKAPYKYQWYVLWSDVGIVDVVNYIDNEKYFTGGTTSTLVFDTTEHANRQCEIFCEITDDNGKTISTEAVTVKINTSIPSHRPR